MIHGRDPDDLFVWSMLLECGLKHIYTEIRSDWNTPFEVRGLDANCPNHERYEERIWEVAATCNDRSKTPEAIMAYFSTEGFLVSSVGTLLDRELVAHQDGESVNVQPDLDITYRQRISITIIQLRDEPEPAIRRVDDEDLVNPFWSTEEES